MTISVGFEWLDDLPTSWKIVPSWSLFRRVKRSGHPSEELLSVYRDHGVIPKSSRDDNHNVESEDLSSYQLVNPGDLVMNKMKAWQGSIALSQHRGIVSPAYFVFEPLHTGHRKYFHYLLRSQQYIDAYNRISKGVRVGQWDLDPTHFRTLPIPVPPLEEQKAIADFLDRELAEIDDLIDTQDGLIALLGKRRQSAITSAVTNGLAADVETESSGNHWLGKIPSHWTMKPLKYLVSLNPTALPESTSDEFEFNYIEISDVTKEHGVKGSSRQRFSTAPSRARRLVHENDVLVSTVRTYLRAVGLVPEVQDGLPFVASTGFAALRPTGVNPNFLSYALTAEHFVAQVESRSNGISYPAINASDLVSIAIPVPPFEEQIQIARHLDHQLTQLDALVAVTKEAIERLYERRSAVVSAAVTGKVDDWGKTNG